MVAWVTCVQGHGFRKAKVKDPEGLQLTHHPKTSRCDLCPKDRGWPKLHKIRALDLCYVCHLGVCLEFYFHARITVTC